LSAAGTILDRLKSGRDAARWAWVGKVICEASLCQAAGRDEAVLIRFQIRSRRAEKRARNPKGCLSKATKEALRADGTD